VFLVGVGINMFQPVSWRHCKRLFASALAVVSPASFAFAQQVINLPVEQINWGLYFLAGLLIVLFMLVLIAKIKLRRSKLKLNEQALQISQTLALMDSFNEASIHLDQTGNIVYVNRAACYFLGKKTDDILNCTFSSFFSQHNLVQIDNKLADTSPGKFQIFERNRHLSLEFKRSSDFPTPIVTVVTIADVTNYQIKIDSQAKEIKQYENRFKVSKLGRLSVDLDKKTYVCDMAFASMLERDQTEITGEISHLSSLVERADLYEFNQAIEQLKKQPNLQLNCQFTAKSGGVLTTLYGWVIQRNAQGESTKLEFLVQNQTEIADLKTQIDISENLTKAVFNSTRHGVYLLDESAQVVACNSAFESLFKTSQSKIKSHSIQDLEFIPEEIRQLHPATSNDIQFSRIGQNKEFTLTTFDKSIRHISFNLKFYTDKQGNKAGMVGIMEDISEVKQAKLSAENERKRFNDLLNLAPLSIAIVDKNDVIVQGNPALLKRLGTTTKELKKTTLYQLFADPNHSAKAAKELQQSGRLHQFKANLLDQGGHTLASELNIDALNNDQQEYLCWIADITAEQYQLQKFEQLLKHSSEPMAILNEQGFASLNAAACAFFDVEDEALLIGSLPYDLSLNKDADTAQELAQKLLQVKQDGKTQTLLWEHKVNGQALPCQLSLVPIFNAQHCDAILCIWKDFRAIKEAERARLEAINMHQAAQRQVAEKQQLLENSQDLLANKAKSLADAQTQLEAAQIDLSQKQLTISDLKQAHEDIAQNLQQLQMDYQTNREKLAKSQSANEELATQLESSVSKVRGLQEQRNQIADALQYSERKYTSVQNQLAQSEKVTKSLQTEQQLQQQKMDGYVAQIDNLKSSMTQKDQQISDVSGQIQTLQSQLSSSGRTTEKLRELLINQRKASEQAEIQRRELEFACHSAQSELSSKARHVEHLQHEMHKFEEMSQQQQGNMQQQHAQLQQELAAKQQLLIETQQQLDETQKASAREKAEKEQQQAILQQLQSELADMEQTAQQHKQQITEANQQWQQQQAQLQAELVEKQQRLQQSEQILNQAKQQTDAEKQDKAKQQEIFAQLQRELSLLKQRESEQQKLITQSEQQWHVQQEALKNEAQAKQQELQETQRKLDEKQHLVDLEKRQRVEQQYRLEQLSVELADVEKRAVQQQALMEGSEEQRRQFLSEIEEQKHQLQLALQQAEQQNIEMKNKLDVNLRELEKAESQVSQTLSGEQKLQAELNETRREAEELALRLQRQEQHETALQKQLAEQQIALQGREQNISELESQQAELTQQLQSVQQEYDHSRQSLDAQDSSQSELAKQLEKLELELLNSKTQLEIKEKSLQEAKQLVENSQSKLAQQEQALVAAHKVELQQAQVEEQQQEQNVPAPDFARLPLPANPEAWFDLLPYLQKQTSAGPLPVALNALMDELDSSIKVADDAMNKEELSKIKISVRQLLALANRVNSIALIDQVTRLEADCSQGLIDNITIAWPSVKKSLMTTLRVIYSHLHA
jgi:epidermal growth factor receptor substrate 15